MALKNTDCYLGREIALDTKLLPVKRGVIAGPVTPHPAHDEVVIVEFAGGLLQKVALKLLITKEQGDEIHNRLTMLANKLAKEFEATKKLVTEKLDAAAALINEASSLASRRHESLSHDYYEAVHVLESAMSDAGWSTSSWHC
jgi:hypothetical protein